MEIEIVYPEFVTIEDRGCSLRHIGDGLYYRDAGNWEIQTKISLWGIHFTVSEKMKHLDNLRLIPCSKAVYIDENWHYLSKELKK